MFSRLIQWIKDTASRIWDWIKKTFVKIVSFTKNIVNRFKELLNKGKLNPNKNEIPIALKEDKISQEIKSKLASGDVSTLDIGLTTNSSAIYTVVYDQDTETIKADTLEIINYESLDEDTKNAFQEKDMLVLK